MCPWAKSHDGVIWLKHFNASHWVQAMMELFGSNISMQVIG
jgi:hypothetical protein